MRGDLVEQSAADACRRLAAADASGVLAVDGPDGPAWIAFASGRIVAAVSPAPRARLGDRLVGAGELDRGALDEVLAGQETIGQNAQLGTLLVDEGLVRPEAVRRFVQEQVLDALFEIVRWRYGSFAFTADQEVDTTGVPLSLAVDDALVEVSRRQHEWRELSRVIPDLEAVPRFRAGAATASASLEPDEFAVLASVDGERSIRGLASDLGYGEFEAARIIYGLSLLGIVDVLLPRDEVGAALEDALSPTDAAAHAAEDPTGQPRDPDDATNQPRDPDESAGQPRDPEDPTEQPRLADDSSEQPQGPDGPDAGVAARSGATLDLTFDVDTTATTGFPPMVDADRPAEQADDLPSGSTKRTTGDEEVTARVFADLYRDLDTPPRGQDPGDEVERHRARDRGRPEDRHGPSDQRHAGDRHHPGDRHGAQDVDRDVNGAGASRSPGPPPPPRRGDDNDVSEFLRELSRLSLDPPTAPGPRAAPPPPGAPPEPPPPTSSGQQPSTPPSDTSRATPSTSRPAPKKRKRRGLFGRG